MSRGIGKACGCVVWFIGDRQPYMREAISFLRHWILAISSFSACHLSNACHQTVFASF